MRGSRGEGDIRLALALLLLTAAAPRSAEAQGELYPYQLVHAYGPNSLIDSSPRACDPVEGCYSRTGALCSAQPDVPCDLQVVPAGRCTDGTSSARLWPMGAGSCVGNPRVPCLADPPHDLETQGRWTSRMCADAGGLGLCDMSGNDNTKRCQGDADCGVFGICSDGDPERDVGGHGVALCTSSTQAPETTFGGCGRASTGALLASPRYQIENPRTAPDLQYAPGAALGSIVEVRTTVAAERLAADASGVERLRLVGSSFHSDLTIAQGGNVGSPWDTALGLFPCDVPLTWKFGHPISGGCSGDPGLFCLEDFDCASQGLGTCSVDLVYCHEAALDGYALLWTRDLTPVEQTGICPPDCGVDVDLHTFELEELERVSEIDARAATQLAFESAAGRRAGAGDALVVLTLSVAAWLDPPDFRCYAGGDPDRSDPLAVGRCLASPSPCVPGAAGDAACAAIQPGDRCLACVDAPGYDPHGLPELDLPAHRRISGLDWASLPGAGADVAQRIVVVATAGRASGEFRDTPNDGSSDDTTLGLVNDGFGGPAGPGMAPASGRTAFALGEVLPHWPGATAQDAVALSPESPGVPAGALLRTHDVGPGPDGIPGCFGDNWRNNGGVFACDERLGDAGDPGNTGADDPTLSFVFPAGTLPGGEARAAWRGATEAARDYFATPQGATYGYADPDPPTLSVVGSFSLRDHSLLGVYPAALDVSAKFSQALCPLIGSRPACTPTCLPGGPPDHDCDGIADALDPCPYYATSNTTDTDGNGRGDECECGDENGDGTVNINDVFATNAALGEPLAATPLCDSNGDDRCNINDVFSTNKAVGGAPTFCARHPLPAP